MEPIEPGKPPGFLPIVRHRGPGVGIWPGVLRRGRGDSEMPVALPGRRHHAAIVPAVDEDECDLGIGQEVDLEHRAPWRDMIALGPDHKYRGANVLQRRQTTVEPEAALR